MTVAHNKTRQQRTSVRDDEKMVAFHTNPRCPALCRQDTAFPWGTDNGANIKSQTLMLMLAMKYTRKKKRRKKKKHSLFLEEMGESEKNEKTGSPSNGPLPTFLSTEAQKSNIHKRKSSFLQGEHLDFFFVGFSVCSDH